MLNTLKTFSSYSGVSFYPEISDSIMLGAAEGSHSSNSKLSIPLSKIPNGAKAAFLSIDSFDYVGGTSWSSSTYSVVFKINLNNHTFYQKKLDSVFLDSPTFPIKINFVAILNLYATNTDSITITANSSKTGGAGYETRWYSPKNVVI